MPNSLRYAIFSTCLALPALAAAMHPDLTDFALYTSQSLRESSQNKNLSKETWKKCKLLESLLPEECWSEELHSIFMDSAQQLLEYYTQLLSKGEELYEATLYAESIPHYAEILDSIDNNAFPDETNAKAEILSQTLCRLGQSYFFLEEYENACSYLERSAKLHSSGLPSHLQELEKQSSYLLALAYRHLGRYDRATETLQSYLQGKESSQLPFYDEVQFELGLNYFLWGRLEEAKLRLTKLQNKSHKPQIYYLSQLYLGRINLAEGDYLNAEKTLESLSHLIPDGDPLHFELAYLRGEASFHIQDFLQAAEHFEQSLPSRNHEHAAWYPEALYQLGWSHLKIVDDPLLNSEEKRNHFNKAGETFATLLRIQSEERNYLAMAQCHLTRAKHLHEAEGYEKANEILSQEELFQSLEAKTHALLLKAESAGTYEAREEFYLELTKDENIGSPHYAKGWYLRGLNHLERADALHPSSPREAEEIFGLAAGSLQTAFDLLKNSDKPRAALSIKYLIQAQHRINTKESQLSALRTIEMLINQHGDILLSLKEPQEIFYLYALMACHLTEKDGGEPFAELAERTLWENISESPNGPYVEGSLHLLGTLYMRRGQLEQAETVFLRLATDYPLSQYADGGLYWCASCAEKLKKDPDLIRKYRRRLFENYPKSAYGPQAYFHYYSYREYLNGDRASIKHIQAIKDKYPQSALLINAYYLIGLDYMRDRKTPEGKWIRKRNMVEAIDAFSEAETTFDRLIEEKKIPEEELTYFVTIRYRAILERALANLAIAEESQGAKKEIYLQYAEDVFKNLNRELADKTHVLSQRLFENESFPRIQEENLYWLLQTYLKGKNEPSAQAVINEMLEKYKDLHIARGYYLSRILYEQGKLAMHHEEYESAWQSFMKAEESDKGKYLSVDQKLDLWIQQSLCYKALNQIDKAMLILSKVINDDAISSLRLKAMFLRAELYELQGRHELARKQLEATAKKGGDWALKAKNKLDKEYGYQ